ncbi:MAG TPA: PilZ domain-containing protein [Candidatus Latescibacteria bacterium]|nr:PilZ domain-containing protein [Candidatus Latescibacterota bacterium]
MLALLAANSYLGIEDANLNHFYWFAFAIFILVVGLLLVRLIGLLYAARREQKASWTTFYQLAKTRGLSGPQSEVLAIVARQAKISRPPKILSSIQLLDKTIQKAQEHNQFSEKQLILIDSVRKKLVSSKVRWTANSEERRQLERANCSWNAKMMHISKESVDKEIVKIADYDGDRIKGAIAEIQQGDPEADQKEYKVQIRDISAGGVALLASSNFAGTDGDYALLYGDSQRIPFTIEGLHGEIQSIEEDQERGCLVLHYRFLPLEQEMRKGIIEYVYEKMKNSSGKDTRETQANKRAITRVS